MDSLSAAQYIFHIFTGVTWDKLIKVSRLPIVRAIVFVPVLGYIILYNEQVIELSRNFSIFGDIRAGYPSLIRIHTLYVSLTAIGMGAILTSAFCPKLCRNYLDCEDYSRSNWNQISVSQFFIIMTRVKHIRKSRGLFQYERKEAKIFLESVDMDIATIEALRERYAEEIREGKRKVSQEEGTAMPGYMMEQIFGSDDEFCKIHRMKITRILDYEYIYTSQSNRPLRWSILLLFSGGIFGISWVSFDSFARIFSIAVPEIWSYWFA